VWRICKRLVGPNVLNFLGTEGHIVLALPKIFETLIVLYKNKLGPYKM